MSTPITSFLFLVDDDKRKLHGIMGVGPSSHEEAYRTWDELSRQALTFQDYLEKVQSGDLAKSTLQGLVENTTFDIETSENVITETIKTRKYIHILNAWEDPRVNGDMRALLASKEFVTIPLITRNEVIGVLMADNAYSGRNISVDSIELLTMLGGSAAVAIENAKMLTTLEEKVDELQKANTELKKTHEMLIRKEKLAAIGEVSARLAHEIRNPLSTIGGFARSIPKKYKDRERTIRNANIIVEEVKRLEYILSNVLDYSKPSIPVKLSTDINELIINTIGMFEGTINSRGVVVVTNFSEDKIVAELDPTQIKQVLINVIQNALYAMPEGGALEIAPSAGEKGLRIDIRDTGKGIPSYHIQRVFEPFFTTNSKGTGLGLAISHIIIQNHNGNITIQSKEDRGTTVSIFLPMK
ncbi:Adaptive-response sensory-kinase SasA [subsurface metagenome]